MEIQSRGETTKGAAAIFVALLLVFAPFSLLAGWNIVTLLVFWFVIVPWIAVYIPGKASQNKNHLLESLVGLVLFYSFMMFLIYDHYQSDYFLVMMASCLVNLAFVTIISLIRKVQYA